jgi:hypothetical protein
MHLVAQSPQWFRSLCASVQALSQTMSVAAAHLHWPAWHDWPDVQVLPQAPQFSELVLTSTQPVPHAVLPVGQPQLPAEQAWPPAHFVSQLPQALAVVCRSTQASPQRVSPPGQACVLGMQLLTAQISPALQALSQLPQCCAELRFEQAVPHSCSPGEQPHLPSIQAAPPVQAVSHEPQCAESDSGSKHCP